MCMCVCADLSCMLAHQNTAISIFETKINMFSCMSALVLKGLEWDNSLHI